MKITPGYMCVFLTIISFPCVLSQAQGRPIRQRIQFEKIANELRELRTDILETKIEVVQANKIYVLNEEIKDSIKDLKILKTAENKGELSDKSAEVIKAGFAIIAELKDKPKLNVDDTQKLQEALDSIATEAVETGCRNFQRVRVTVGTTRGNDLVNNEFEIYFRSTGGESEERRMGGGQLAPLSDQIETGVYLFWTQDPQVSTRRGEPKKEKVCGQTFNIRLPVPLP